MRTEPLEALIPSIRGEEASALAVVFPRVVREYIDVFPGELPRVPPPREIEFVIDTPPNTSPTTLPMHRMAPT